MRPPQENESELEVLRAKVERLKINLNTCKNDYWKMTTLLQTNSLNKDEAIKDCIERMEFRKPLFEDLK